MWVGGVRGKLSRQVPSAVSPDVADLLPPWPGGVAAWGREGVGGAPSPFLAMPLSSTAFLDFYLFFWNPAPGRSPAWGLRREGLFSLGHSSLCHGKEQARNGPPKATTGMS